MTSPVAPVVYLVDLLSGRYCLEATAWVPPGGRLVIFVNDSAIAEERLTPSAPSGVTIALRHIYQLNPKTDTVEARVIATPDP